MTKLSRDILYGKELEEKLGNGVEKIYQVARAAYGPNAGNAIIELNYGGPQISRDGVTNVSKVHLADPVENLAARTILQASEKSNKKVGDGTSAVVILANHLYKEAVSLVGSGQNRMVVSRLLQETANDVIEQIDQLKVPIDNDKMLEQVARVSAGDEAIGAMIADTIKKIGINGGVIVEDFEGLGIYNDLVEGIYFRKGFTEQYLVNNIASAESVVDDADILIMEKPMKTASEIAPIIDAIVRKAGKGKELVIIGDVDGEALATLAATKHNGTLITTLLDVPYSPTKSLFLEDIAIMTGGKVLPLGAKPQDFSLEMLGGADRIVVNAYSTTIIGAQGAKEDQDIRLKTLEKELASTESAAEKEYIKDRLAKLTGKIAIIRVGGATNIERDEVKLRVEDAIAATQAAIRDGVVPGGGVCLAKVEPKAFKRSYLEPFKTLIDNAGYNPEQALFKVQESDSFFTGYDLRNFDDYKTIDVLEAGVIDPAEVIKEVVRNSASVVSQLITAQVSLTFVDREMVA